MKIGVIGTRTFTNQELFEKIMIEEFNPNEDIIITGDARGADQLARNLSPVMIFKANWNNHGRSAGMIRNQDIINHSEKLIAFWDGKSPGTKHSINLAKKKGIPITIITVL